MNDKRFDRNLFRHARISTLLLLAEWYLMIMAELRRPEGPPSGSPYSYRKGNPWVDFHMFIMGSGIARGRVRTTATTTESRNMVAILPIIGWQKHAAWVNRVLLWYWTSMLWSIDTCQSKVSADQYHFTISRAQVTIHRGRVVFFEVDRWPSAGFRLDRVLMSR